ncbi:hypothetical protein PV08_02803 [Exophiala spinifera]|uniref:Uncharacterized protein n=1 Tax=Exophiala spinifera TaxID=91928 RepID=A0A0D2BIY8_9EURO|nr:uncharacterized protein PV08_02803 [Exophiala spinifera]KIW18515.1 hypothetical protein PV08_02803 [Exophiala spinifera]
MSAIPPPPIITINAASNTTISGPGSAAAAAVTTAAPSQTKNTAPAASSRPQKPVLVKTCYLCDEQNPGDFSPTTKFLEQCLLCSRYFCPIHKSEQWDQVCNINHSSYYHECLDRARAELAKSSSLPDDGTNKRALAEQLINEGIYPSLGEREKAIFSTSPVSDDKIHEIEQFRSLDAALTGQPVKKGAPVEEVDLVGADIAV